MATMVTRTRLNVTSTLPVMCVSIDMAQYGSDVFIWARKYNKAATE